MGLIICIACGRQRQEKPIKRNAKYRCINCKSTIVLVVYHRNARLMEDWSDKEGVSLDEAKRTTYAALRKHADVKGYKLGWAKIRFEQIFGERVNGYAGVEPAPASSWLLRWIRKENAQYRKQKKQQEHDALCDRLRGGGGDNDGASPVVFSSLMNADDWEAWT